MADKDAENDKKKKKSVIASLDLKNYKAKYTDSYGLGKPNEIDLDNFLIAEPDSKNDNKKEPQKSDEKPVEKNVPSNLNTTNSANIDSEKLNSTETSNEIVNQAEDSNFLPKQNNVDLPETIKVDRDFEQRIENEANNDFFDEKPLQNVGRNFRSKINRNNENLNQHVDDKDSFEDNNSEKIKNNNRTLHLREPIKVNVRHELKERSMAEDIITPVETKEPPRRTETYGIVISAVALLYSVSTADKALVFLSLSLLLYLMRPIIAAPFGKHSQEIQNAIKGFSIALFIGAIFFVFF